MSRLDQKVEEENRLAFIADKKAKRMDALRAAADLEIRDWMRARPEIGDLQTSKGKTYYIWDEILDCHQSIQPFQF